MIFISEKMSKTSRGQMVGVVLQDPCEIVQVMLGNTEPFSWGYDVCMDLGRLAWDALFSPNNCYYRPFQTNF